MRTYNTEWHKRKKNLSKKQNKKFTSPLFNLMNIFFKQNLINLECFKGTLKILEQTHIKA